MKLELELQAYLDGELSGRDARRVEKLLAADQDAQALFQELNLTRSVLLSGNEPELKLPETREFYWSKIQRDIERCEAVETAEPALGSGLLARWRRYLAPMAGVASVVLLGLVTAKVYDAATVNSSAKHFAEIENLSDETGSYSFRSQSENMFVVWVYDRDQEKHDPTETTVDDVVPQ